MNSSVTPLVVNPLIRFIPWIEAAFLIALIIGLILFVSTGNILVLQVSLIGLALCYFLSAYRSPSLEPPKEGAEFSFQELLAIMILPKTMWMATSIICLGMFFYSSDMEGHPMMFLIGGLTIGAGVLLLLFFMVTGVRQLKAVFSVLYRAIPALLAVLYFQFMK